MSRKELVYLLIIFVLSCSFRLFFVFDSPYLSSADSYFDLRITENIRENHIPNFHDPLGYGGRTLLYSPIFYYLFYLFSLFLPLIFSAKLFSSILISLLVIPIFLICKRLTKKTHVSLLISLLSTFIPANLLMTFNTFSPYCLMMPLIFFTLYFIMDIKKYTMHFIVASIIGAAIHPSFLLLVIGFLFYLLLVKLANFETNRANLEAILFSSLLAFWVVFIIYKNAFLSHGIAVIWQGVPEQILRHYFFDISILEVIYKIGIVPLLAGIFVIYRYISSKINKDVYFLISLALSIIILTTLHLLKPEFSLAFTGIILTILFGVFLSDFWDYLANARFRPIRILLLSLVLISLVFTNVLPSLNYVQESIKKSDLTDISEALTWLNQNSKTGEVVLSSLEEGHLVTFFAKRPNVIDAWFILQTDAGMRLRDTDSIYKTSYSTEAIPLLNKYGVKYILFTPETAQRYKLSSLKFVNEECFEPVYDKNIKIYRSLCKMDAT